MSQPDLIVFCAFTRRWAVERWLTNLASMRLDPEHTSLAIIIDIDEPFILNQCRKFVETHKWKKFVFKMNDTWHPNEVRIAVRRLRIADVKNQSKDLINQCEGEYILCFEDDTVFEGMDVNKLLLPLMSDASIGFVEGVQCGRWGVKMIGAWQTDNPANPHHVNTLMPKEGLEEIAGGGWYGYVTRRLLYLNCEYFSSSSQPWGPDVNYGFWLRNQGYKCFVNWDVILGHNDFNVILYPDSGITQIEYNKDLTTGRWQRNDTDRSS